MADQYNSAEEVLQSAQLALAFAAEHCVASPGPERTCAWYHGVWQYFRLLDVVATPWDDEVFFRQAFRELAVTGSFSRLLICGCSDYSLLALLLSAYRDESIEPEVTVIDLCPTPLLLNRWFAERHRFVVATQSCDALHFATEVPFDVICTHSFMGNFAPAQRSDVVARWRRALRPGGRVITAQRIRPGGKLRAHSHQAQSATFLKRIREGCVSWNASWGISREDLINRAERYSLDYASYPVCSLSELVELFATHGFQVERATEHRDQSLAAHSRNEADERRTAQLVFSLLRQ